MERLADIGEDALIARLLDGFATGGLHTGPGDDCAVVDAGGDRLRLLKADAIVEGVHFKASSDPRAIGWKAAARVISDFAAMGGRPEFLLVTLALPGSMEVARVEGIYRGLGDCLHACGGTLAGGETCSVPEGSAAVLSVAGEGSVARDELVCRSGAAPGDVLVVTGRLGGSLGGRHLNFRPRLDEGRRLGAAGATAMMDLSDGLAKDLPRLARASGCGFEIDRGALPRHDGCSVDQALGDGEDYELLVAIPEERWHPLLREWPADFAPLTAIGRMVASGGELAGGWDHFGGR